MYLREPRVEVYGQAHQALGLGRQCLTKGLVEANPDGKLDEHGPQAAKGVHAVLPVQLHRLL